MVEPTAAALLALREEPRCREACDRAQSWLVAAQNPDGGWGLNAEDSESSWQTGWAVLALARSGAAQDAPRRGAAWLLSVAILEVGDEALRGSVRELLAIDPDLRGWPWRPGESSFVEPTALAVQALDAAHGAGQNESRLEEAAAYLRDRRCPAGGWNVGNPVMLGKALLPRAHPTAWALLALARIAPQAIVPEDLTALLADMEQDGGALALAWGLVALAKVDQEEADAEGHLVDLQSPDGGWNANPYHTAVAALALQGRY